MDFNSLETVREDGRETVREAHDSGSTVLENDAVSRPQTVSINSSFKDYRIVRQLPSTSTEADIYVVNKSDTGYILKLYRYGINPKNDILQSIKSLSEKYPKNFIRIYDMGFDAQAQRWYEIQEYAKYGTLQTLIDDSSKARQASFFREVASQVGNALDLLHQNNLLHLDVKPSNILLRSKNPLDMVLIDFGIATSLASDMSKKFTQTRGTPMYQSPESYTGGMGWASDWWGLGMILLEIANGSHPFKGLSSNVIAYSVATEPVNVPNDLEAGQKELIHGLLTRNPEKRWNWSQVSRWLNGERNIPHFFEEKSDTSNNAILKPFTFMGQRCRSLEEIAAAFVQNEQSWEKGEVFLMRGNIRTWLEQNGEFEQGEDMDRELTKLNDSNKRMFKFTQQYGRNIPLVFCGKAITLKNLLLLIGKDVKREKLTDMEQKIVNMISNGKLLSCLNFVKKENINSDFRAIKMVLTNFKKKSNPDMFALLNFYLNPDKYYCPFVKDKSSVERVVQASQGLTQAPRLLEDFTMISNKYIVPKRLIDDMGNAKNYNSAFTAIEKMRSENHLILRQSSSEAEKAEKERLASASLEDYTAGMYKLQWGYDETSVNTINSSLEKFRKQAASASGSSLEKAQLKLWIKYLEYLAKKVNPLSDTDKKFLRDVKLDRTEELYQYIKRI